MDQAVDPTALYQDIVLDRARHPRHMHGMEPCDAMAVGDNPLCGDRVEVRLRYAPDGTVAEAAFEARGCAISVAAADLMADAVAGRSPEDLRSLADRFEALMRAGDPQGDDGLEHFLPLSGVHEYPSRIRCATLPWHALLDALGQGGAHG